MSGGRYHKRKGKRTELGAMARRSFDSGHLYWLSGAEDGAFCSQHRADGGALVKCQSELGHIGADLGLLL